MLVHLEHDHEFDTVHRKLDADDHIEFVSRVPVRYLLTAGPEPAAASGKAAPPPPSEMWNLVKISWAEARSTPGFKDADAIRVAVLDTGSQPDHPDLQSRVEEYIHAYPGPEGSGGRAATPPVATSADDPMGHGTHVSGVIGARPAGKVGATGICRCALDVWKVYTDVATYVKVTGQPGGGVFAYEVDPLMYRRALAECLERGVDVMNLSLGGPGKPDPHEQILYDELMARGTSVVAAMGNEKANGNPVIYPAAIPGVVAVGATLQDDSLAPFSCTGEHIALCAPGMDIWSTLPTYPGQLWFEASSGPDDKPVEGKPVSRKTSYDKWPGTSAATPQVAAAAALLLANRRRMSSEDVRQQLMRTADKVPAMKKATFDPSYGSGRLNLLRLLTE
jgi:subtilisin family serine protease